MINNKIICKKSAGPAKFQYFVELMWGLSSVAANEWVFGKVLDKNVPSADGQLLNSCSIAQFLLDCPMVLGLPKLLPKESTIVEFIPSASTLLNTFVVRSPFFFVNRCLLLNPYKKRCKSYFRSVFDNYFNIIKGNYVSWL